MSELLGKDQLENLSTEDILSLNVDSVEKLVGFALPPEGLYTGTLLRWELPEADNNHSFVPHVALTGVIELEDPEVEYEIPEDSDLSVRFMREVPVAVQALFTNFEGYIAQIGEGSLGQAIANGDGTAIVFRVEHRMVYKRNKVKLAKPEGPYLELRDVTVA